MSDLKLYMMLLGCKPAGRNTEQHDVFFCVGRSFADFKEEILLFWPEANGKIHIDAWRKVQLVDGYEITVSEKTNTDSFKGEKLFFLNLGGYKKDEFEEFHYKLLTVANDKGEAIMKAKQTAFYKHTGFKGATSHIDDKYGIDVDDVYEIEEILPAKMKEKYAICIRKIETSDTDEMHLGYFKLDKL